MDLMLNLVQELQDILQIWVLIGVVASKRVTEAPKGFLSTLGNRA